MTASPRRPFPPEPAPANLEHLRKRAKALLRECRAGDAQATARVTALLPRAAKGLPEDLALHDAQLVIAREHGFESWPRLVHALRPGPRLARGEGSAWIEGVPTLAWGDSCTTTYVGCVAAACEAVGRPFDVSTLMGDSGLAFRVRWVRTDAGDGWGGQGPLGECPAEMKALAASTGLAWRDDWEKPADPAAVVAAIDAGRPVLAYALLWDVGLVYGYTDQGRTLRVRHYDVNPDTLPLEKVNAIVAWLDRIETPLPRREAVLAGLNLAVRNWSAPPLAHKVFLGPDRQPPGHIWYGAAAIEQWLADIASYESLSPQQRTSLFWSSWWCASNLKENLTRYAPAYLREHAPLLNRAGHDAMLRAAGHYERVAAELKTLDLPDRFMSSYKHPTLPEHWTEEVRQNDRRVLREVLTASRAAISEIHAAVEAGAEA